MVEEFVTVVTALFNSYCCILEYTAYTVCNGDVFGSVTVVVAFKCCYGEGVRADNCYTLIEALVKRQKSVVFEHNKALLCSVVVKLLMLLTVKLFKRNVAVGSDIFKFTEQSTDCVKSLCCNGDFFFCYKVLLVCIDKSVVCIAAVEVAGALECSSGSLGLGVCIVVVTVNIAECTAVGNNITVEIPLVTENINKQVGVSTAGVAVCTVVCTHNTAYACLNSLFKSRKVSFKHIVLVCDCVEAVTCLFRA